MAKIQFWNKLLEMPKETQTSQGTVYQFSEYHGKYLHKMTVMVSDHLDTEHKVVFMIGLSLFPFFNVPANPKPSHPGHAPVTLDDNDDDDTWSEAC